MGKEKGMEDTADGDGEETGDEDGGDWRCGEITAGSGPSLFDQTRLARCGSGAPEVILHAFDCVDRVAVSIGSISQNKSVPGQLVEVRMSSS